MNIGRVCQRNTIVLAAVLSCVLAGVVQAVPVATVQTLRGTMAVQRGGRGAFTAISLRGYLSPGDIVATGVNSKATLLFASGAQLRLNASSRIQILAQSAAGRGHTGLFRAIAGEVWAQLRPGQAALTRSAICGVRGTEIVLRVAEDDTTTLAVTQGEVEFYNDFGEVLVGENQQSVARPGQAPTKPVTIENAGFIVEWTLDLNRAVIPREKFFISLDPKTVAQSLRDRSARATAEPQNSTAQRALGDALFDSRRYEDALAAYQNAERLEPKNAVTLSRIGHALLELDRLDEAAQSFEAALAGAASAPPTATVQTAELTGEDRVALSAAARSGLAALELVRAQPAKAQSMAELAVAGPGAPGEAYIALGLANMRQAGHQEAAATAFQAALKAEPARYRYQAHAWLALLALAGDDTETAVKEGTVATREAPFSGLAHGNLSLVYFFTGKLADAKREATRAVELNPQSVAARVALGQVQLAQGEADAANETAAQAVALDPSLPQARYLLGIADAGRRDYGHARRELQETLRLSPEFLPAANALARVYNAMGQQREAIATVSALLPRHRQTDAVQGALGEVYYEQGRYAEAAAQYRAALEKRPNSALYYAGLTRTLLYSNRLNGAIKAGQEAVRLAPQVGQYHALLGLAYDFSGLGAQAERELREARTRDPQNALALTQLAFQHTGADLRTAAVNFAQGFLLDPTVSRQMLRGGIDTELTPVAGNDSVQNLNITHRLAASEGRLHSFGFFGRDATDGSRNNDDRRNYDLAEFLTWTPGPLTNTYFNLRGVQSRRGLAGSSAAPDDDDRSKFRFGQAQAAARHRFNRRASLWVGVFGNSSRNTVTNPDFDSFFSAAGFPIDRQKFTSQAVVPEARLDVTLGNDPARPSILTLGISHANTDFDDARHLNGIGAVPGAGDQLLSRDDRTSMAYAQLAHRVSDRLSVLGQLRAQRTRVASNETLTFTGIAPLSTSSTQSATHLLPSFLATFQADAKTALRLFANRRVTEATTSTFAPAETLLTTERGALPFGVPDTMNLYQLDVERYLSKRSFVKLFAFHARADRVQIGGSDLLGFGSGLPAPGAPLLLLGKWKGSGIGARYERQLTSNLFANANMVWRDTSNRTRGPAFDAIFSGQTAPYEPRRLGGAELHYVDPAGNKVGVAMRYVGSFFEDSPLKIGRSQFPARAYFDLKLAREASVAHEFFLNVTNLFNGRAIEFRDFPGGRRRIEAGVTRRF